MSEHLPETNYLDPEVLQKLGDLELVAREVVEGLRVGTHRSSLRGFSTEFAHHRQYSPGDALRDLDWRVFGRTDRYYTKLYEAETNFDCTILIDASASMNYASGKGQQAGVRQIPRGLAGVCRAQAARLGGTVGLRFGGA